MRGNKSFLCLNLYKSEIYLTIPSLPEASIPGVPEVLDIWSRAKTQDLNPQDSVPCSETWMVERGRRRCRGVRADGTQVAA